MTKTQHRVIAILFFCSLVLTAFAQLTPERLRQFIDNEQNTGGAGIKNSSLIKKFYTLTEYKSAWLGEENKKNLNDLFQIIKQSASLGLEETDYQSALIATSTEKPVPLNNSSDSLLAEIQITGIAIHFLSDLVYGNTHPVLGYNGLNYSPLYDDIPAMLASYLSTQTLSFSIIEHGRSLPEIRAIEKKLEWMQFILSDSNFNEVNIAAPTTNGNNKALLIKLYQLGLTDSLNLIIPDSLIKKQIKEAQRQFNLLDDGTLRPTTLQELNVPLQVRLRQLKLSVNYYRWLYYFTHNQSVIVVNIPAACLKVYHDSEVILKMRMVVGKPSTPTPTLSSRVNEVILYPYWNVPHSIAVKELLPSIKRNPGFIAAGDFQVLSRTGKILNPYSINWQELNAKNFPYTIRQSTGCDNALGLLKLNFYSPYGVYLHDTPMKSLFMLNKRYFSHGCMRMEEPVELGHLILKNNQIAIDTLTEKGCLRNQSPVIVPADEQMPVIVWYNPAGIDSTGRVIYYEDVYKKFEWMKQKK